jgi:hypothetical protein
MKKKFYEEIAKALESDREIVISIVGKEKQRMSEINYLNIKEIGEEK